MGLHIGQRQQARTQGESLDTGSRPGHRLQAWTEAARQARTSLLEPDTVDRTVVNLYEQKDKLLYGFISTRRRLSLCRGKLWIIEKLNLNYRSLHFLISSAAINFNLAPSSYAMPRFF
jgi:hypothetical protein